MKVRIDKDICSGCGLCEETCPEVFRLNEDEDIAEVIKTNYSNEEEECIKDSIDNCPEEAISID